MDTAFEPESKFNEVLKRLRKSAKVSQVEMGALLHLHQSAISRIESGIQSITPEELLIISRHFGVRVDSILSGEVDYTSVSKKFGAKSALPPKYSILPYSKVREILPHLKFLHATNGPDVVTGFLSRFSLNEQWLVDPDMSIGVNCHLDLARSMINNGILSAKSLPKLIAQTRSEDVQGFLHRIYATQESALLLVENWVLNAHHYEKNFEYKIEDVASNSFTLSISPAEHMQEVDYKDETLSDYLCRFKKAYLSHFPAYIGKKPLQLTEKSCHFHGDDRCIYQLKTA